jgi:hypothetical protein
MGHQAKITNKVPTRLVDGFVKGPLRTSEPSRASTTARQLHQSTDKARTLMRGALKKANQSV